MKIQHKRSNQLDGSEAKAPLVEYMEYGELAVNFNAEDPAIFVKVSDGTNALNDEVIRIAGLGSISGGVPDGPSAERPDGPGLGDLYFDTDLNLLLYWDGSSWQPVGKDNTAIISETAPNPQTENLAEGTFWWDSSEDSGRLFILYNDPTDSNELLWVEASPGGGGGSKAVVSETPPPPSAYLEGDMWWNCSSDSGQLFILYDDPVDNGGGGKTWVAAAPSSGDGAADLQKVTDAGNNTTNNITLGTDKITLDATDGGATFAGDVQIGADAGTSTTQGGINAYAGGAVDMFRASNTARSSMFTALSLMGNSNSKVKVFSIDVDGETRIGGDINAAPNIQLSASGSATFKNTVIVDGPNTGAASLLARSNYQASTGNQVFLVRGNTDNDVAWIAGDGRANFEGVVTSPSFDAGGKYTSPNAIVARATGNTSGSGAVRASNNTPSGATYVGLNENESTAVFRVDNTGIVIQRGLLFEIEPDNDDNYTTTTEEYTETESYTGPLGNTLVREVTKTRELRTYTGPRLDVKERLTKADNALLALKSAAEAATDFAELKAAITTALADI